VFAHTLLREKVSELNAAKARKDIEIAALRASMDAEIAALKASNTFLEKKVDAMDLRLKAYGELTSDKTKEISTLQAQKTRMREEMAMVRRAIDQVTTHRETSFD
jgi:chromosome segregation ATPase